MLPPLKTCRKVLLVWKQICWQNGHVKGQKGESLSKKNLPRLTQIPKWILCPDQWNYDGKNEFSDRNPPRDNTPAPQIRNPNLEETLLKSGKGIPGTKEISEIKGIKENREVLITDQTSPAGKLC
jgi:hypothetical protein